MVDKLLKYFMRKSCKSQRKQFRTEKLTKKKGDKLCVKWKGYDS